MSVLEERLERRLELVQVEARDWFSIAIGLDLENRELRRLLTLLLFAAVERRELLAYAHALIEERFPAEGA